MSAVISKIFAIDTLSNTAESEKTNNLIDDPDRDLSYHCLRGYFSLRNAIRWSRAKVRVNGRSIL